MAMQGIHPVHTQTQSSMEHHGFHLAIHSHAPRPHPRPRFMWCHLVLQTLHPNHTQNPKFDGTPWVPFGYTKPCAQTPSPMEPMGFSWPEKTYTQTTPKPRALWSPMGFHLATQSINPDHTQTQPYEAPWAFTQLHSQSVVQFHRKLGFQGFIVINRFIVDSRSNVYQFTKYVRASSSRFPTKAH